MTLLEKLNFDRSQIIDILTSHKEVQLPSDSNIPLDMLYKVYIDTLEDSLKTLNSMVDCLRKPA
jgi:hypothetical protein